MRAGWAILAIALTATPALGQGSIALNPTPSDEQIAAARRHNQEVVAKTPGSEGVLVVRDDGVKHLQSGLICPLFPHVTLQTIILPDAPTGQGVSCRYGRVDKRSGIESKLVMSVAKAATETTVTSAFEQAWATTMTPLKEPKLLGPVTDSKIDPWEKPQHGSGTYSGTINQLEYLSDIVVAISKGWIIEIHASYPGKPGPVVLEEGESPEDAMPRAIDRSMARGAFFVAAQTAGQ